MEALGPCTGRGQGSQASPQPALSHVVGGPKQAEGGAPPHFLGTSPGPLRSQTRHDGQAGAEPWQTPAVGTGQRGPSIRSCGRPHGHRAPPLIPTTRQPCAALPRPWRPTLRCSHLGREVTSRQEVLREWGAHGVQTGSGGSRAGPAWGKAFPILPQTSLKSLGTTREQGPIPTAGPGWKLVHLCVCSSFRPSSLSLCSQHPHLSLP